MSKRLAVGPEPQIKIEFVEGDLRLVGWDNDEILVKTDDDAISFQQDEDEVSISCQDDLAINLPKNSKVHIQTVNGDMSVRGLTGDFEVDIVNGDVAIRDAGQLRSARSNRTSTCEARKEMFTSKAWEAMLRCAKWTAA